MSSWNRTYIRKLFIQLLAILIIVVATGMMHALPTSSDPGDGGRWIWDEEHGRRMFIPEGRGPQRPTPAMDPLASSNGVTSPFIEADPQYEQIYGWDWPLGNTVYVCVDSSVFAADPTDPAQCDLFDDSMVAYAPSWDPTYGLVYFDVWGVFDLQGSEYISMTDTVTTKEHLVTNLTVTGADAIADTVSGTADPGLLVNVYEYGGGNWLFPIADGSGDWLGSYSSIYDLLPGSNGSASQYDADSDLTWWYWEVPNPTIEAQPDYEEIKGWEWPEGEMVHVCVDSIGFAVDPTNPAQCDLYHGSDTVELPPGWSQTRVEFDLDGILDLQGGHYITMTDGTTTKEHQVTNLAVTDIDLDADTVSGTADPGSEVDVWVWVDPTYCGEDVVADGSGDWTADFSGACDMIPGSSGGASQYDGDYDETYIRWSVPNPRIEAQPEYDDVEGREWPEGETVDVCIDDSGFAVDPTDPTQCNLYHGTGTAVLPPGWSETRVEFDLDGILDLQGGHYIAMTDGTTTKQHQVTNLAVTDIDSDADTVSGTADPGSEVDVWVWVDPTYCGEDVVANGSGDWTADFSGACDMIPGSSGGASQQDGDLDETYIRWSVLSPRIEAQPEYDDVEGRDWPEGETVHLCVDDTSFAVDPTDPGQCDLFYCASVVPTSFGSSTYLWFDLSRSHDLAGGEYITMSDGVTTKEHRVTNLDVTGVDLSADIVFGVADPGSDVKVDVWSCSGCIQNVVADGSGDWQADFSGIADLDVGSGGLASQFDADADETIESWGIYPPSVDVYLYPEEERIDSLYWLEGNTVHLCITEGDFAADPTIPGQCSLYYDSMTATVPPDEDYVTLVDFLLDGIFDVAPGQYVSLSDGITRSDLLVANLTVTGWDVAADTLTGTADPNEGVLISVFDCNRSYQYVTADGSGDWVADFSGINDLQPGDQGDAVQYNPGYRTHVLWSIPLYELFLPLIMR